MADSLDKECIEQFCRKYPLFTTDITFRFKITDNSTPKKSIEEEAESLLSNSDMTKLLVKVVAAGSPRATTGLQYKALHPISTESWYKANSIHSYRPDEFKSYLVNVSHEQVSSIRIYDILYTFREASNVKKTPENLITIAELLALPEEDRDKRIEKFYNGLREALPPPNKLLLPYTSNIKERKDILMARLAFSRLYDDADMSSEKAVYKLVRGIYEDEEICFPYAFEVLAIPFKEPTSSKLDVEYIGAVNYSISPREDSNTFEGDYNGILGMGLNFDVVNIRDVLHEYRFGYHHDNAKVPCLIVANLVTPRRDPHGYDKSRIDIHPFVETIVDAIRRMASGIQTYRAVGIKWVDPFNRSSAKRRIVNREDKSVKEALRKFLVNERGLRDSR